MATPGSALVGYAILQVNYDAQAPNYLDNFAPFVLSAIASSDKPVVERSIISGIIRENFGIDIPSLVIPQIMRRTNRQNLTAAVSNDSIRLTANGLKELPDLNSDVIQFRKRQNELVGELAEFIENTYPEHLDLTTKDLGSNLAAFFDKHAVPLLGVSLADSHADLQGGGGFEYVVAAFINHLHDHDQLRFSYVVEAAKGAMLASVLELDTSNLNESLNGLTIVLDTPVIMDILGYHGEAYRIAMDRVTGLAKSQGAKIAVFQHSLLEVDGILDSIENSLKRGTTSKSTGKGYRHFAEVGATPSEIALLRHGLENSILGMEIQLLDRPDGYLEYGLDEKRLEKAIQDSVHYLQDAARLNDVHSISAVHRLRQGQATTTMERCRAVLVSTNNNLVRGASQFNDNRTFPLVVTAEAMASFLWVRSPAAADDVPRETLLASVYSGMQPSPMLWKKYLDKIQELECTGEVTSDQGVLLRSAPVSRETLMEKTLGDVDSVGDDLPKFVLERVQEKMTKPLETRVEELENKLNGAESDVVAANESANHEMLKRKNLEDSVKELEDKNLEISRNLELYITETQKTNEARRQSIIVASRKFVTGKVKVIRLILQALLAAAVIWVALAIVLDEEFNKSFLTWLIAFCSVAGVLVAFIPFVKYCMSKLESRWTKNRARSMLLLAGFKVNDELEKED